ncbi:exported hypothetical protein [Candidatus Sulfotelmatobacter sp. SbA7]|nr:exported hypothetical protein [Candidatus Sulfotelmatobacter sp. SbA7]
MVAGDTTQTSSLVAVSAAVGAVVASAFSTVAILVNGAYERRSRRTEATVERQSREQEARLERQARHEQAVRERSADRKQLLMQEAGKLADWRLEIARTQSDKTNRPVTLTDPIVLMEGYYNFLTHLWKHGKLPNDPRIER